MWNLATVQWIICVTLFLRCFDHCAAENSLTDEIDLVEEDDFNPRFYIQTQNYTLNLFPIVIPVVAFIAGKRINSFR